MTGPAPLQLRPFQQIKIISFTPFMVLEILSSSTDDDGVLTYDFGDVIGTSVRNMFMMRSHEEPVQFLVSHADELASWSYDIIDTKSFQKVSPIPVEVPEASPEMQMEYRLQEMLRQTVANMYGRNSDEMELLTEMIQDFDDDDSPDFGIPQAQWTAAKAEEIPTEPQPPADNGEAPVDKEPADKPVVDVDPPQ